MNTLSELRIFLITVLACLVGASTYAKNAREYKKELESMKFVDPMVEDQAQQLKRELLDKHLTETRQLWEAAPEVYAPYEAFEEGFWQYKEINIAPLDQQYLSKLVDVEVYKAKASVQEWTPRLERIRLGLFKGYHDQEAQADLVFDRKIRQLEDEIDAILTDLRENASYEDPKEAYQAWSEKQEQMFEVHTKLIAASTALEKA